MKWPFFFLIVFLMLLPAALRAAEFSEAELSRIGHKIWRNEANVSVEGLTAWNEGENFASLGIGHFIWYPKNQRGPFDESFPKLVRFMASHGAKPPAWVTEADACPWSSRAEFQRDAQSERLKALRKFLADTISIQTAFIVERMEQSLPKMVTEAEPSKRDKVRREFERLKATPHGAFALIDYVNFKGEGTLATERYKGEGWGLLQVLENMDDPERDAARAFANSAKAVLTRRVRNAPPERHEERWLAGWKSRIESYASE
jgi:hypothetical protein